MQKIHWGVLGCATIAEQRFIPSIMEANNAVLCALATRGGSERLSRIQTKYPIPRIYYSYDELLGDPNIDAVYIPLPNGQHVDWTVKAAIAKKHVLCEKPMALSPAGIDAIAAAGRQNGVQTMEAFACMHSPLYPSIREWIANGEIGELRTVSAVFCYLLEETAGNINASRELAGGSINDVGCYNMLTIRQITQREPQSIIAKANFLPTGVDSHVDAILDMGDGVLCFSMCSIETAPQRSLSILGTHGYIAFDRTPNAWGLLNVTLNNAKGNRVIQLDASNNYTSEIEQFGRCILDGEPPKVTLGESRLNARALEMLHAAIR